MGRVIALITIRHLMTHRNFNYLPILIGIILRIVHWLYNGEKYNIKNVYRCNALGGGEIMKIFHSSKNSKIFLSSQDEFKVNSFTIDETKESSNYFINKPFLFRSYVN